MFSNVKSFAQNGLNFEVEVSSCEEKWVVCESQDDSSFQFGFVFPTIGGITFRLEGGFTVDVNGVFVLMPIEKVNKKVPLFGGMSVVALLPESKFSELKLGKFPTWYDKETNVSGSLIEIYTKGIVHNSKGEYDMASVFLNEAFLINPDYLNLRYQLAIALNGTRAYDKAIMLIEEALKLNPTSYELYKELSYSKMKIGEITSAEEFANKGIKLCGVDGEKCQMALNIAVYYSEIKDAKKFDQWVKLAEKYATEGDRQFKQIALLISNAKKW